MLEIKILGSGCANCIKLANLTKEAVDELGLEANIEKVTDMQDILSYGVMRTPGLVVNGEVKASGRVPKKEEIKEILQSV
ncbi:redox-active disulfide protein 2 [Anoxybacter fermentans]|uniref:Redox-active disulfide protein 2 n=1 Tax=Anoxybacter fermentans TaxID=1323375 RepID=A0A3S9SY70_9FIRM|nr:thioredoxin family protein [Anoxybacter fermentans]AZR73188.1 redox-active disulfide protein 2 [Anoxybacter fermentans]